MCGQDDFTDDEEEEPEPKLLENFDGSQTLLSADASTCVEMPATCKWRIFKDGVSGKWVVDSVDQSKGKPKWVDALLGGKKAKKMWLS